MTERAYRSFAEFYPFYLSQHAHPVCRGLHVAGVLSVMVSTVLMMASGHPGLLVLLPVIGYGCSWTGHFVFERNVPATFNYPWYSLLGDFRMAWETLTGRGR